MGFNHGHKFCSRLEPRGERAIIMGHRFRINFDPGAEAGEMISGRFHTPPILVNLSCRRKFKKDTLSRGAGQGAELILQPVTRKTDVEWFHYHTGRDQQFVRDR